MIEAGTGDRPRRQGDGAATGSGRATWTAPSVGQAREGLVTRFAEALAEGRDVIELKAGAGLLALEVQMPGAAVVLVRDADGDICGDRQRELLLGAVDGGHAVVVEFPETLPADLSRPERPRSARDDAAALREALPDAVMLAARTVEVTLLEAEGADGGAELPAGSGTAHAWLVCAGASAADVSSSAATQVTAAGGVSAPYVRALHEANLELRRANARLAREHLGRYDSAAATLIHKFGAELRETKERLSGVEAERDRLYGELMHELVPERDELLRRLRTPQHRMVDRLALALLRLPLVGFVLRRRRGRS